MKSILPTGLLCLCALPLLTLPSAAQPSVRGLLIGICDYKDPAWPKLAGAGKDPLRLRQAICSRFKVSPDSFRVLDPARANRKGIEEAFLQLSREAQPGDTVVVFYAGHGDQVKDRPPPPDSPYEKLDEQDGLDECLVPIDAPAPSDPRFADAVVRDDFIEYVLAEVSGKVRSQGKSGSVLLIFDSCHSGTISRSAQVSGRIARTSNEARPAAPPQDKPNFVHAESHKAGAQGWVVLSACLSRQTAKELPVGGDFTTALTQALEDHRLGPQSNYRELMRLVNQVGEFSDQQPQADGDLDLTLLGGGAQPRLPSINVVQAVGSQNAYTVTVDKGQLLGITAGSTVSFYPLGSRDPSGPKLAEGVVQSEGLSPYKAKVRIEGARLKLDDLNAAVGWVTRQAVGEMELKVHFSPQVPAARVADLKKKLSAVPVATVVADARQADVVVLPSADVLTLERTRSTLGPNEIVRFNASQEALFFDALKDEARRNYLTKMINQPQKLKVELLAGRFDGKDVATFKASPSQTGKDGLPVFRAGDQAMLKITNNDTKKLYISVLDFGSQGEIEPVYPLNVDNEGEALAPGQELGIDIKFSYDGKGQPTAEGFKVFATREPLDLQFLKTRGTKRGAHSKSTSNPFGQLFESASAGTRGASRVLEPQDYVGQELLRFNVTP